MSKKFVTVIALVLAMILSMGVLGSVLAGAAEGGYDLMSVYKVNGKGHAYEMGSHMLSSPSDPVNQIPQTLVMVSADNYSDSWSAEGAFEALYCCDVEHSYASAVPYKRVNLEDSTFFSDAQAGKIRAIVMNSYPFVSLDSMKAMLRSRGFAGADKLTRSEAIAAVQAAIWACSNGRTYSYIHSFDVASNPQWGLVHNDITDASESWIVKGNRVLTVNDEAGSRINRLRDFLLSLNGVRANANQTVISDIDVTVTSAKKSDEVNVYVELGQRVHKKDTDLTLTVFVNGVEAATVKNLHGESFRVNVKAESGDTVKAVVSGTQTLARGVYFYVPEGGREVSQCMVGVSQGDAAVYAEASVTLGK